MTTEERSRLELERDYKRWNVRRRITISCVITNTTIILFYMLSAFFLDPSQAEVLQQFNSIAITIIGGNFSIILGYLGLATYDDVIKRP